MLIVGQNREVQSMFGNGDYIQYYNSLDGFHCVSINQFIQDAEILLMGKYKTKERAMQVMRQIQDAYANNERVFIMPDD